METIRQVVETFIRLVKAQVHPEAVLVSPDDVFEVPRTPSVILQGPTLIENKDRRTMARLIEKDIPRLTYEQGNYPYLYHLDFEIIVTTSNEADLLDYGEKVGRFYQVNTQVQIGDRGFLNVTELVPLGGLRRVNLSNLRQSSGKCRIEDCPVYDGKIATGPLIKTRRFEYNGGVKEERVHEG